MLLQAKHNKQYNHLKDILFSTTYYWEVFTKLKTGTNNTIIWNLKILKYLLQNVFVEIKIYQIH